MRVNDHISSALGLHVYFMAAYISAPVFSMQSDGVPTEVKSPPQKYSLHIHHHTLHVLSL